MQDYTQLQIWQTGMSIVTKVYAITQEFPASEQFGLSNQIRRSAVSIPSNIAEGASRSSKKDFCRFLEIAMGSSFELETQLTIAKNLQYISMDNNIFVLLSKQKKMLYAFLSKLKSFERA